MYLYNNMYVYSESLVLEALGVRSPQSLLLFLLLWIPWRLGGRWPELGGELARGLAAAVASQSFWQEELLHKVISVNSTAANKAAAGRRTRDRCTSSASATTAAHARAPTVR